MTDHFFEDGMFDCPWRCPLNIYPEDVEYHKDWHRDQGENPDVRGEMLTDPTWDTEALKRDFEVVGFKAPYVVVKRRSDGAVGTLEFTHAPRVYFKFVLDDPTYDDGGVGV